MDRRFPRRPSPDRKRGCFREFRSVHLLRGCALPTVGRLVCANPLITHRRSGAVNALGSAWDVVPTIRTRKEAENARSTNPSSTGGATRHGGFSLFRVVRTGNGESSPAPAGTSRSASVKKPQMKNSLPLPPRKRSGCRRCGSSQPYFLPPTAVRHFPYSSSRWVAYSSGFEAAPVPWKPAPVEVVRP